MVNYSVGFLFLLLNFLLVGVQLVVLLLQWIQRAY